MSEEKRRGLNVTLADDVENHGETEETEVEFTKDEEKMVIRANEDDFIQGLIAAADYTHDETQRLEIIRGGKLFFAFNIRPLSSEEYDQCRKKYTKYAKNKQFGMKLPQETNTTKYQAALIQAATVPKDREKLWDNKKVWEALREKGLPVMNGLDVIEYTLMAGEKSRILEAIDTLSGFSDDIEIEDVAKN